MNFQFVLLCALIYVLATFVHRVCGFGMGVVAIVFLPYLFSSHMEAASLSSLLAFLQSGFMAIRYRKQIRWKLILPILAGSYCTTFLVVRFGAGASFVLLERLLGATLIGLSLFFLFLNDKIKIKPSVRNGVLAGCAGGAINGLFAAGGPPVALYLMNTLPSSSVYFATLQAYFTFNNIYSSLIRFFSGLFTPQVLLGAVGALAGIAAGNWLGAMVSGKIPEDKFRLVVYLFMIVCGIIMLI